MNGSVGNRRREDQQRWTFSLYQVHSNSARTKCMNAGCFGTAGDAAAGTTAAAVAAAAGKLGYKLWYLERLHRNTGSREFRRRITRVSLESPHTARDPHCSLFARRRRRLWCRLIDEKNDHRCGNPLWLTVEIVRKCCFCCCRCCFCSRRRCRRRRRRRRQFRVCRR